MDEIFFLRFLPYIPEPPGMLVIRGREGKRISSSTTIPSETVSMLELSSSLEELFISVRKIVGVLEEAVEGIMIEA